MTTSTILNDTVAQDAEIPEINRLREEPECDPLFRSDPANPALMHRSLTEKPRKVDHAEGSYLYLGDGRKILDACGGAAVAIVGHRNLEVVSAVTAQLEQVAYVHTLAYTTDSAELLAEHLISLGYESYKLSKAYLVGSGSEANEAALKAARQYHWEKGDTQRRHYVSRRQAYHGNTFGAMTVSSNLARKAPYNDILPSNVSFVSPAYAYRYQRSDETESDFADRLIAEIRDEFLRIGPEKIISFIAEPVVGATSGSVSAPKGYFKGVRELCSQYGILLHLDEIMCGVGRTGTFFAFEQEGIRPDIVTIGKGLGGGYIPVSAMLLGENVVQVLRQGTSAFNHGQTFQAHPGACAAGLAVLRIVSREGLVERCAKIGEKFGSMLRQTFSDCKHVGDIRGRGLFWALEFVEEKDSRRPFPQSVFFGPKVQQAAFDLGVALYPGSGTIDGKIGDHVLIAPPLTVSVQELQQVIKVLRKAYDATVNAIDKTSKSKL